MKTSLLIVSILGSLFLNAQNPNVDQQISNYTLLIRSNPDSINYYINRGKAYNEKGEFAAAIADYNVVLRSDPKNLPALKGRGYALYQLNKLDSSIADLTTALKLAPNDEQIWNLRGLNYYWQEKYDNAVTEFSEALRLNPRFANAWYNRGNSYYWKNEFDKAIGDLSQSLLYDSINTEALYIRGMSYTYSGKFQLAINDFTRGFFLKPGIKMLNGRGLNYYNLGQYSQALIDFNEVIRRDPADIFAWIYRGNTYSAMEKYTRAITDYSQALLINANSTDALYKRGLAYHLSGNQENALADFTRLIYINPKHVDAVSYRGDVYTKLLNFESALKDYADALKIDPLNADVFTSRGICYKKMGKFDLALKDFNSALNINPKSVFALTHRGDLHSELLHYEEAIKDYTAAINIDPGIFDPRNNRGNIFFNQQKYDLAESDYTVILSQKPDFVPALSNRGYVYRFLGKYEQAVADLTRAVTLDPASRVSWSKLGDVYLDLLNYDSALYNYNKALRLSPSDTSSLNNRGLAYSNQKKYKEAIADFNAALKINPRYTDALNNRALVHYKSGNYPLAIADLNIAHTIKPGNSRILVNLILVNLAADKLKDASALFNEYRQKKLSSYMETVANWNFLKSYIIACCDHITKNEYETALELLEQSLKEYKDANQDRADIPVSREYANILVKTAFVYEKLSQKEKALEHYRIAHIINPLLPGITARVEAITGVIKKEIATLNTPASLNLLTPKLLQGTIAERADGNAPMLFVSGTVNDPAGIEWVNANGTQATTLEPNGFFAVKVKNDVNDLTIQSKNKAGRITTFNYQLQNTSRATENSDIPPIPPEVKPGYHAILIAISDYNSADLKKLPNTVIEARAFKNLLTSQYGFKPENIDTLYNKGFMEIVGKLYSKLKSLNEEDNLVIFFAGHGTYKTTSDGLIGYWIPLNSTIPEIDYISNIKMDELVGSCKAKHILLLSDACYSAAMRSDGNINTDVNYKPRDLQYTFKSRQILTSGGLEKVPEKSIFMQMVMKAMQLKNRKFLSALELYNDITPGVVNQTNNRPQLNLFGKDGNEGGQFYFIRNN